MTKENLAGLEHCLQMLGFTVQPNILNELNARFHTAAKKFEIYFFHQFHPESTIEAMLYFEFEKPVTYCYFRKYEAIVRYTNGQAGRKQNFFMTGILGNGITIRQALNLLEGRAAQTVLVADSGGLYNAWVKLNFNQQDRKGNYAIHQFPSKNFINLYELLDKLDIKNFTSVKERTALVHSLWEGDAVVVTLRGKDGTRLMVEVDVEKAALKTSAYIDSSSRNLFPTAN